MNGNVVRWRRAGLLFLGLLLLGACAGHRFGFGGHNGDDGEINAYPVDYKSDILAAMHAYLNDPAGIRDAAISQPMLKEVAQGTRYIVCLRFNGKRDDGIYMGVKQIAAIFLAGRFQDFADVPREPCLSATYAPFPELEQLKP